LKIHLTIMKLLLALGAILGLVVAAD